MTRVQGTVKWFSNKKGYGFIEPTSEDAPTKDDIFVHQSSVTSDGYRTLIEGWVVEFDVVNDDDGKLKADNVTAPGGGPCTGPRRRRRNKPNDAEDDDEPTESKKAGEEEPEEEPREKPSRSKKKQTPNSGKQAQQPQWHDILEDNVKEGLDKKGIRRTTGTVDVSIGPVRIKLGTRSYTSMAHEDGILAEGSFTCDEKGAVGLQWERALQFKDGSWSSLPADGLITSLVLTDDAAQAVGTEETPESLWGAGKTDPKDELEKNGFQMRRVVLTPKPKASKASAEE
eukprot:CAMPEP_0116549970 /NCGR_PEP_ID=MMETSP0397-20121206/5171_1 /TAXON_ID=216820 /ORGANISM="Cyclophora tenuis, Strain ECT3854" /LENGTH=284 /DNA_ID=CAMNT_0004074757 /DNA_START=35 /DNA_END=889 /DNA_ORIENTATION=-